MCAPIPGGCQGPARGRRRRLMNSLFCTGGIHQRTASRWPWHCSVCRFLLCYVDTPFKKLVELTIWTKCAFPVLNSHTVWLPYIVGWGLVVSCVIVNDTYLWKFSIQMTVFSVTLYLIWGTLTSHTSTNRSCTAHMHIGLPYWHIWIYLMLCVLGYLCSPLTKVLFETSFKQFQYNTKGRRLSNHLVKLIFNSPGRMSGELLSYPRRWRGRAQKH